MEVVADLDTQTAQMLQTVVSRGTSKTNRPTPGFSIFPLARRGSVWYDIRQMKALEKKIFGKKGNNMNSTIIKSTCGKLAAIAADRLACLCL